MEPLIDLAVKVMPQQLISGFVVMAAAELAGLVLRHVPLIACVCGLP